MEDKEKQGRDELIKIVDDATSDSFNSPLFDMGDVLGYVDEIMSWHKAQQDKLIDEFMGEIEKWFNHVLTEYNDDGTGADYTRGYINIDDIREIVKRLKEATDGK